MELKLTFTRLQGDRLPLNYQYALSSWVYKVIEGADSHYSDFLHNRGHERGGRHFKMFTFSQLDARPYKIVGDRIHLLGKELFLNLRFAVDASLEHFIKGLFMQQRFGLGDKLSRVDFEVTAVETLPLPVFTPVMTYRCLSPVCVSRLRTDGAAEYMSPEMSGYGKLLVQNLVRKSAALAGVSGQVEQAFPEGRFRLLNTPRRKGVHIRANTAGHTQVIGYLFHFELTVPVELHEIGYEAGFGEKNSMGFGCVQQQPSKSLELLEGCC